MKRHRFIQSLVLGIAATGVGILFPKPSEDYHKRLSSVMKFSNLLRVGLVGLLLAATPSASMFAQRPSVETDVASLFSRSCQETGRGNLWTNSYGNIAIGRRLYKYNAVIAPGSSESPFMLVCRINSKGSRVPFGTLRLSIGQEDSSGDVSEINLYLNGNSAASYTLREGQIRTVLLDVSRVEDFAIEATRVSSRRNAMRIYIVDATLEPLN